MSSMRHRLYQLHLRRPVLRGVRRHAALHHARHPELLHHGHRRRRVRRCAHAQNESKCCVASGTKFVVDVLFILNMQMWLVVPVQFIASSILNPYFFQCVFSHFDLGSMFF